MSRYRTRQFPSRSVSEWFPNGARIRAPHFFSPLDLSPVLWLDAADTSTITAASGKVSEWRDKSPSGYKAVQATAAKQPTTGSVTINNLNAIDFDGGDGLSFNNFDMTGSNAWTVALVFTARTGAASFQVVVEHSPNYNNYTGAWVVYVDTTQLADIASYSGGGFPNGYNIFRPTAQISTTPVLLIGEHDGSKSTDENSGWLNASGSGTRPFNNNTTANNANEPFYIGGRLVSSQFLTGRIGEIIVWKRTLTSTERTTLEAYLNAKWALY